MSNPKKALGILREKKFEKCLKFYNIKCGGIAKEIIKRFIHTQIQKIRQEIIKEFTEGKRCFRCGELKEEDNVLSDWCGKCLEEL